jgi:pyruvate ferredoxin oxidoreductase alpha subunit
MKTITMGITGNDAVGEAMRQINPDVVAAYPITPQTELVEKFAEYYGDGKVTTELVTVESEHSAMSAVVGASAAGSRAMTATSANGLALMWEIVYIAASLRLPIVMPVVNRALSGPINIHCDHSDMMGARDSGWIQIYSENGQEAYDNTIQAIRIGEHMDVRLPVMIGLDGFIISHTLERVDIFPDKDVKDFIGEFVPVNSLLRNDHPVTIGPLDLQDYYFEHKKSQFDGMNNARKVILEVADEFAKKFGRKYGYFEEYRMDGAKVAMVSNGSTSGTAKVIVDQLRKEGIPVGLINLRVFRPWPDKEIREALKDVEAVGVFDRSLSFGDLGGPLFTNVRSSLMKLPKRPLVIDYVYGLGGRDMTAKLVENSYRNLLTVPGKECTCPQVRFVGLRSRTMKEDLIA